eukprot:scaffold467877_cov18-Prasinocladus_malaysianus.AAC.2
MAIPRTLQKYAKALRVGHWVPKSCHFNSKSNISSLTRIYAMYAVPSAMSDTVPTITCTSSNVVQTVLQGFAQ